MEERKAILIEKLENELEKYKAEFWMNLWNTALKMLFTK